jgi:hypothetical protein
LEFALNHAGCRMEAAAPKMRAAEDPALLSDEVADRVEE